MDAYPLALLGEIYMARGDRSLAVAAFEQAAAIATAAVEVQALVPALTGLALARLDDDPAAALDAATRAVGHEATVHHAKALIALGWVRSATGDRAAAVDLAERAGRLARERGDHVALALALELAAAVRGRRQRRRGAARRRPDAVVASRLTPRCAPELDVDLAEITPGADGVALAASAADALDRLGAKREAVRARAIAASAYSDAATRRDRQRARRVLRARGWAAGADVELAVEGRPRPVQDARHQPRPADPSRGADRATVAGRVRREGEQPTVRRPERDPQRRRPGPDASRPTTW